MPSTAPHPIENLATYLPAPLKGVALDQQLIPTLAKNKAMLAEVAAAVKRVPTTHELRRGDATQLGFLEKGSVHLVLTSPPYWNLKKYEDDEGQLGHVADYGEFLDKLDRVWCGCFDALVPGGRLICVVGDVCLSRKKNNGVHEVIPLHAAIQERCRSIGFTNLTPILWHKIANATYEAAGNGGGFLGKPYEPNAVIKNDIEYILMFRKPGGYRSPSDAARLLSVISEEDHRTWFQSIWTGVPGESTRNHPAPYPLALAERLVRMFSFVGDTVFDPFSGTATTAVAAANWGRNSCSVEVSGKYFEGGYRRLKTRTLTLFAATVRKVAPGQEITRTGEQAACVMHHQMSLNATDLHKRSGQRTPGK